MNRYVTLFKQTFTEFNRDKVPRFARSAIGSSFGAAGSLVIVLLWVYYSAQILLFGAEFTQVYARAHGSLKEGARL